MSTTVDGIVLAAGRSTRMGKPKLLLEIQGIPVLIRVVQAVLDSRLSKVIMVLGPSTSSLESCREFQEHCSRLVLACNPNPEKGMSSSLQIAMEHVDNCAVGGMVILADQPWLTEKVINDLIHEFSMDPRLIVQPSVNGRRTTPVIFPADFFRELRQVKGDVGGRAVLERHRDRLKAVEMGSYYDDSDVDTPEDFEQSLKRQR